MSKTKICKGTWVYGGKAQTEVEHFTAEDQLEEIIAASNFNYTMDGTKVEQMTTWSAALLVIPATGETGVSASVSGSIMTLLSVILPKI